MRLLCTLFVLPLLAFGQSERGNITGLVTDVSGAAVPTTPVIITNVATNSSEHVNTTSNGEYNAPNLVPGVYRIEISASGFKRFVAQNVTLTAGATIRQAAQMQTENAHGIGGASSGAIAAFTVAWERPAQFHKVLSIVGSFVNLCGGHTYADIIRKADKKPIRIFLQDGRNDNRGQRPNSDYDQNRDWFYQNVRLMKVLTEKGYDINYTWGMNKHGQKMGGAVLPEMMRGFGATTRSLPL